MDEAPERRATIADVARAAGVSTATVSLTLNGKSNATAATQERVRAAAARLGYVPSVRARRLRAGRARSIAIVTTTPAAVVGGSSRLGFLLELAIAAAEAALVRGYSLVLVPPLDGAAALAELDIDGAVLVDPRREDPYVATLAARGVAVVTIGQVQDAQVAGAVDRGSAAAEVLLEHLAVRGARRVALLIGDEPSALTADVTLPACRWAEAEGRALLQVRVPLAGGERAGREAVLRVLQDDPAVDAVYAPIDALAVGAVEAAAALGRRVPEDLMVATHYDGPRARSCSPPLTALDLHLETMARQGVELLLDHLEGREHEQQVTAPRPTLVPRRSTER